MRKKCVFCIVFIMIFITGCAKSTAKMPAKTTSIEQVLQEQTAKEVEPSEEEKRLEEKQKEKEDRAKEESADLLSNNMALADSDYDYDLTLMDSDMVYATVYQFIMDPDPYIGKTVKMEGLYYSSYYEKTGKNYQYVMIQDALACCSQGIEFVWGDGSHTYPDDYPEDETKVIVSGTFETYKEDGDENLYCRLQNATLEIVGFDEK